MAGLSGTTSAARPSGRALVRNLRAAPGPGDVELVLDARSACDFLVTLMLDTEPEILPEDAAWLADARGSLSDALRRDVGRAFEYGESGAGIGMGLAALLVSDASVRSSADVVAAASRIGVEDLVGHLLEAGRVADPKGLARAALAGDAEARDALIAAAGDWTRATIVRALDDPDGELRALRRALRAWHERYRPIEERIAAMLERDVEARRTDAAAMPLVEFVEKASGGIRWVAEPGVRRLVLVPTYFGRPYNYLFGERETRAICYPLAETALDGDVSALPTATVRLFKALGDESRLRILRLLADGDLYLTEIAERMSLSKPTVKHHMVQLRAAGLVTVSETGGLTYYSLRRERIADASGDLRRLVGA